MPYAQSNALLLDQFPIPLQAEAQAGKVYLQRLRLGLMQVKIFTLPCPRLPVASIILCGWKAVQAIGLPFEEMSEGVYGWRALIVAPLTLKMVRLLWSVPLLGERSATYLLKGRGGEVS